MWKHTSIDVGSPLNALSASPDYKLIAVGGREGMVTS